MFCIVLGRLFYVQVIWGDRLQEKAIDQWTREIPVIAARGKITDVNGVILADNNDTYTVFVRKKAVLDMEKTSKVLSDILNMDYAYVYNRLRTTISSEVTVKKQVDKEKINKIIEIMMKNLRGGYGGPEAWASAKEEVNQFIVECEAKGIMKRLY